MSVRFPNVSATCVVPGTVVGASGTITARVVSTADRVTVTDTTGGKGTVAIDGNGRGYRGWLSTNLDADKLREAAQAARTCASALRSPTQRSSLRTIAQRLEQLAASR